MKLGFMQLFPSCLMGFFLGQKPDAMQVSHDIHLVADKADIVRPIRQNDQVIDTPDLPACPHLHLPAIDGEQWKRNRRQIT